MSARTTMTAYLRENTDLTVLDYAPENYAAITDATIFVAPDMEIRWGGNIDDLAFGAYEVDMVIVLVVPYEDYRRSEDALDGHIADALNALDRINDVRAARATRVVYADKKHGYSINITMLAQKESA
ncbi:hypothetical protein [Cellulosimicrobium sp. SL-1]|uniref:hypothetical protein n=1 Tax=Cellulosimicrobium sp. SL-1 TaxID=2699423 RepID=UPI0013CF5CD1|nr:hypothetical protein [Cellulosimicrobium sp. SL-1]